MSTAYDADGHTRTALPAYFAGGLSPADTYAVESHLARCPQCLAESERIGILADQLSLLGTAGANRVDAEHRD
jgi:anti-sigma factor RsiW